MASYCIKAFYLLHAHLLRVPVTDAGLLEDQQFIIENALHLVLGQLQIALARGWLITSLSCMSLSQMIVQAVYDSGFEQEFLQLPFLTSDILKHFKKKMIKNVPEFLKMNDADRTSLLRTLKADEVTDVVRIAQSIPQVKIAKAEFLTLGEVKVIAGGLVTLVVRLVVEEGSGAKSPTSPTTSDKIDFDDLDKKIATGDEDVFQDDDDDHVMIAPKGPISNPNEAIYAPYLKSMEKKPFWWVILAEPRMNNFICPPVKVHDLVTSKTVKMQFVAPNREGTYQFVLYLKSDSFVGLDLRQEVKV